MTRGWLACRLGLAVISMTGCQFQSENLDSILVVAVDAIPPIYCDEGTGQEVLFRSLCQESVRFTHAFSTSTSAQAALASVLTGLYPFEHLLRDNSTHSALAAEFETLAERALKRGYRTSLLSGGPPIWRTSGLGQGFEMVEDNVTLGTDRFFRKVSESVDLFLGWLDQGESDRAFFTVLYAPDYRFPGTPGNHPTDVLSGELERLWTELKRRKRWDNTHVVLVGLSGTGAHLYDPVAMALTNRTTQVPLLVKPARKPRDTPLVWKVDANVSLADLGAGLLDVVGPSAAPAPRQFEVRSLLPVFRGESVELPSRRMIPVESAWAQWRMKWNVRYALLNGENLFIHDREPLVYNMLVDREQMLPLNQEDPNFRGPVGEFERKVREMEWAPFEIEDPIAWRMLKQLESDSLLKSGLPEDWKKPLERFPMWLRSWVVAAQAKKFYREQDWKGLERWAQGRGFLGLAGFLFKRRTQGRGVFFDEGICGAGMSGANAVTSAECQRSIVKKAHQWARVFEQKLDPKAAEFEKVREAFFRDIDYWWVDRSILMINATTGFQWDVRFDGEIEPQYFHFLAKFHRLPEVRSHVTKHLAQLGDRDE